MGDVLAIRRNDGVNTTPEQCLEDSLERIRSGEIACNKAVVLFLDDRDGDYWVGFHQAGMTMSQLIALMRVTEIKAIQEMGHVPGGDE